MGKRLAFLGAALLMIAAPAAADSFVLRPDSSLNLHFEGNGFLFVADKFSAQQDIDSLVGVFFGAAPGCDPCSVGETFNPSFTLTNTFMGTGPATVGSASYSKVSFFGDLSFVATPLAFPTTDVNGLEIKTPFTFTGMLRGFEGKHLAFSASLTGHGYAARFFDRRPDGRYVAGENRLSYIFTESQTQTPEPASVLLLATGVAGLIARKRAMRAGPSR